MNGPLILDSGTFQYNYSKQVRNHYRSLDAHSTIVPEKPWPVKPLRNFAWQGKLYPTLEVTANRIYGEYLYPDGSEVSREIILEDEKITMHDICSPNQNFVSQFIVYGFELNGKGLLVLNKKGVPELAIVPINVEVQPIFKETAISNCYGRKEDAFVLQYPAMGELKLTLFSKK